MSVVLLGYAESFERTLEAFYESVQPFAAPFMAQIAAQTPSSPFDPDPLSRYAIDQDINPLKAVHNSLRFASNRNRIGDIQRQL